MRNAANKGASYLNEKIKYYVLFWIQSMKEDSLMRRSRHPAQTVLSGNSLDAPLPRRKNSVVSMTLVCHRA
jgi:hypothetical protein